jgi:hypothetical protein
MKILPVGTELLHADRGTVGRTDRQTDMTKTIVAFCNFANAPENLHAYTSIIHDVNYTI